VPSRDGLKAVPYTSVGSFRSQRIERRDTHPATRGQTGRDGGGARDERREREHDRIERGRLEDR
jgi:hypothetical protein